MKFDYKLSSIGWADVEVEIDNKKYFSQPGYSSEPLVDLLEGLLSIIPNCVPEDELKTKGSFTWDKEPGIDKWNLQLTDKLALKIVIDEFEDEFTVKGKIVFDVTCNLLDFLEQVINSLERLLSKHGFVGYKNTWYGQDFPISSFLKLKNYLISQTSYPILKEANNVGIELHKSDLKQEIELLLRDIREI